MKEKKLLMKKIKFVDDILCYNEHENLSLFQRYNRLYYRFKKRK